MSANTILRTASSDLIQWREPPATAGVFSPPRGDQTTKLMVTGRTCQEAPGLVTARSGRFPLRSVLYLNGDLFRSSTPPDLPGIQPCPLCDYLCHGGSKDRFPCDNDSQCPGGGECGTSTECLGGIDDGSPCTPGTSDEAVLGNGYPVSHDCRSDPLSDITSHIGGLPVGFAATAGTDELNAVDRPNGARVFCGYCRDVTGGGSLCFEGDPGFGLCCFGVCDPGGGRCLDDSECPGGICELGLPFTCAGPLCLADSEPHATNLVSIFCIPPTFFHYIDVVDFDLPGPGVALLQGEMQLQ